MHQPTLHQLLSNNESEFAPKQVDSDRPNTSALVVLNDHQKQLIAHYINPQHTHYSAALVQRQRGSML